MPAARRDPNSNIILLGENLDAALAAAEDLLREQLPLDNLVSARSARAIERAQRELRLFVAAVRDLEIIITARVAEARKRTDELRRTVTPLRPLLSLFTSGTAALVDAVAELGDATEIEFASGNAAMSFLRRRAMVPSDAASLGDVDRLSVCEDYLVAGRIRLGTLMDLIATFLDTLDRHYDLFPIEDEIAATLDIERARRIA